MSADFLFLANQRAFLAGTLAPCNLAATFTDESAEIGGKLPGKLAEFHKLDICITFNSRRRCLISI